MTAGRVVDDNNLIVPERFVNGQPHADWKTLRDKAPVYYCRPDGYRPYWAITKYDDIVEVERTPDVFLNEPRFVIMPADFEEYMEKKFGSVNGLLQMMAQMDAPQHTLFRDLLRPWFTPKALQQREDEIRRICESFFDKLALKSISGEFDFVQDLAGPFPLRVVCSLLGLPPEDDGIVLDLAEQAASFQVPPPGAGEQTGFEMVVEYFKRIAEERRINPKNDISTYLVQSTINGKPLKDHELFAYFFILATAGHDTTTSAITGGVKALIEHPDQLQMLRDDPSRMRNAVDEILRWVTPTVQFARTAARDYELRGQMIRKGESVALYYASGNRDEDVFDRPYEFDINRSPNKHLTFGIGPHACLGMQVARMEISCFLHVLLDRVEFMEIVGPTPSVASSVVTRIAQLPLRYRLRDSAALMKSDAS